MRGIVSINHIQSWPEFGFQCPQFSFLVERCNRFQHFTEQYHFLSLDPIAEVICNLARLHHISMTGQKLYNVSHHLLTIIRLLLFLCHVERCIGSSLVSNAIQ